ncbi:MAG: hypothetical protein K6G26_10095 [Lachnospiraceae bacterium]|nr:hypothetical protein [Lachnospiraceae bacterium]
MFRKRAIFLRCCIALLAVCAYSLGFAGYAYATETTTNNEQTLIQSTISSYYSSGVYNTYYYNQLDTYAKVIYEKLLFNAEEMKSGEYTVNIYYDAATVKEDDIGTYFQSAIDAFDRDHPEIFWLALNRLQLSYSVSNIDGVNYVKNVKIGLVQSTNGITNYLLEDYSSIGSLQSELNEYKISLNKILREVEAESDFDTVKNIHDYLVKNNDYNTSSNMSMKAYKSVSAIIGHIGDSQAPVCEGYSRAFKVICDRLGIPCIIASGNATLNNNTVGHMWNIVNIEDHWYYVDTTWDDPVLSEGRSYDDLTLSRKYAFFLVGSTTLSKTHSISGMFADKLNYNFYFKYPLVNRSDYSLNIQYYSITVKKSNGGTITTNAKDISNVEEGTQINVYVEPDTGMEIVKGSLKYNDIEIVDNTFIMPASNVVITYKFMKSDTTLSTMTPQVPTVSPENSTSGTSNPTKSASITHGVAATEKPGASTINSNYKDNTDSPAATAINIRENTTGDMPSMKFNVDIKNNLDISTSEDIVQFHLSEGLFDKDINVNINERPIDTKISDLLVNKFGTDTFIEATVFDFSVKDKDNNSIDMHLEENQEFVMYVPVSENFVNNQKKIRVYYIDGEDLIVTNTEVVADNDKVFLKMYLDNTGSYVMVEEIGKIEITDDQSPKIIANAQSTTSEAFDVYEEGLMENYDTDLIALAVIIAGWITLVLAIMRKIHKASLEKALEAEQPEGTSEILNAQLEKIQSGEIVNDSNISFDDMLNGKTAEEPREDIKDSETNAEVLDDDIKDKIEE